MLRTFAVRDREMITLEHREKFLKSLHITLSIYHSKDSFRQNRL